MDIGKNIFINDLKPLMKQNIFYIWSIFTIMKINHDIIYIGFPIWWYVAPTIINAFLKSYDLSGKTIIPLATSGSVEWKV